jgi:catalase
VNRTTVAKQEFPERLPVQLVQDFHAAFGELFAGASVPVMVRFSDFTGLPDIPDTEVKANPRGFAVRFSTTPPRPGRRTGSAFRWATS